MHLSLQRRTETIFDAVIAIAMTMIALEIAIPYAGEFDANTVSILFGEITVFFVSFIVLASIWWVHAFIYSFFQSLGGMQDIVINILLMFLVTLFPVLTKLMSQTTSMMLNLIYVGCYGLMVALEMVVLAMANRKDVYQKMKEFQRVVRTLELLKEKLPNYDAMQKKLSLVEQYMDDADTFSLLYLELLPELPQAMQVHLQKKEHDRKERNRTVKVFSVVTFLAVSCSALAAMVNPYWCYPILAVTVVVCVLVHFIYHCRERRLHDYN